MIAVPKKLAFNGFVLGTLRLKGSTYRRPLPNTKYQKPITNIVYHIQDIIS